MAHSFDFGEHEAAAFLPEMTLEMYKAFPEDASSQIEVVDGWMVRCESAGPNHQGIQFNLLAALRDAAKLSDRGKGACHRVLGAWTSLSPTAPSFTSAGLTSWSTDVSTLTGDCGGASHAPRTA